MMASSRDYQGSFLTLPPWKISEACCVLVFIYTYLMAPFTHLLLTLYLSVFSAFFAEKLFSVWFMSLLCNQVSVCDDQVKSCNGHGGWFSSICSLPDYISEPINDCFFLFTSDWFRSGQCWEASEEKKKKSFLLREFLKSKCSSYGNVEQSCYRYSTRGHPETEADVEKLAGGECLGYYVFIATWV